MKAKQKINYGWIFILICLIILFSFFFIKNSQMNREKSFILQSTEQYYRITADAFTLSGAELESLRKIPLDSKTQINTFAEKTAQDHWEAITSEIAPLFADKQTFERHAKVFQDLFKSNIENRQILLNVELTADEKPTFKWNLLNQIKVMSSYRLTYKFDDELTNEFFKATTPVYTTDEIIWIKTDHGFKIGKSGWLINQHDPDFYKPYSY